MRTIKNTFFPILSLLLSIAGLVVLISLAVKAESPVHVVSSVIFGAGLIILYAVYTVLNILRGTKYEGGIRKIHNAASYVLFLQLTLLFI